MKKAMVLGYIIGVLLLSGFARAEETLLAISHISSQPGSWLIQISGPMKNACVYGARPRLERSVENENQFILRVIARERGDVCAQVIRGVYTITADLRLLLQETFGELTAQQNYVIKADGYDFEVGFTGEEVAPERESIQVVGLLLVTNSGDKALITEQNRMILLDDTFVSADSFLNRKVLLAGRFGPSQNVDERTMIPTRRHQNRTATPGPRLLVTEIQMATP